MKFHVFYTDDLPREIVSDHQRVCDHLDIDVEYHIHLQYATYDEVYSAHGNFITDIIQSEEVACFLDIDCLPFNKTLLEKAYQWTKDHVSFVGNAQNISHTVMRNQVYAAASCLMVSREAWNQLGTPSMAWYMDNGIQIDTAQLLTLRADSYAFSYQLMYPQGWDSDESYKLAGYGMYGKGTKYPATWHYGRISHFKDSVPEPWTQRVQQILNDEEIVSNHTSIFY